MSAPKLKYLSTATIDSLRENIAGNVERYRSGDFSDLMQLGEWDISLDVQADLAPLSQLDPAGTPEAEIKNSRFVWQALHHLTPTLACEEGIWARLTHVECLTFSRARWIPPDASDAEVEKSVRDHFFAPTLTSRRDDNAVSRLWWNAYVANLAAPEVGLPALEFILQKADIRSNFVERSLTASRPPIAAGIVRLMRQEKWITDREDNFRSFMRTLNRLGGGMLFEVMPEGEIDSFMRSCAIRAGLQDGATADHDQSTAN
jgi:Family of unknown function (DUF6339)